MSLSTNVLIQPEIRVIAKYAENKRRELRCSIQRNLRKTTASNQLKKGGETQYMRIIAIITLAAAAISLSACAHKEEAPMSSSAMTTAATASNHAVSRPKGQTGFTASGLYVLTSSLTGVAGPASSSQTGGRRDLFCGKPERIAAAGR